MKLFKARFNQRAGTPDGELKPNPVLHYPECDCLNPHSLLTLHLETQDPHSAAWEALENYIREVAANGCEEFNPSDGIGRQKWEQIITLPRSIAILRSVKVMMLYGSHLVRIPPEIGEMTELEEFDPYTSYCLHWFPYEITHCKKLRRSRVSTRALYGNYKFRPPFPPLPSVSREITPSVCSVCRGQFGEQVPYQVWISLQVATDVLPLLVHACSSECIQKLPEPPNGYVPKPHRGGLKLQQPRPL